MHTESVDDIHKALLSALDRPQTRIGILGRERVIWVPKSPVSGDQELIALVWHGGGSRAIYGHVFKPVSNKAGALWNAQLIDASEWVDAYTPEALSRMLWYVGQSGDWEPMYAQGGEEVFAVRDSFEAACSILTSMAAVFDFGLRCVTPEDCYKGIKTVVPPGRIDCNSMDGYGTMCRMRAAIDGSLTDEAFYAPFPEPE